MKKVIVILTLAISFAATPALASGGKRPDPAPTEKQPETTEVSVDFLTYLSNLIGTE
ncbi:hypothetical protein [Planctobacterium marinum]|uniref:Uncharacterized protein n=1 Tax=Planctobacterium marinum TaxID=1631968 RepID=A0AA48HWV7_9ALTE|nr:hypothetical protein MACH26_28690 [Planctobacterium marinum]